MFGSEQTVQAAHTRLLVSLQAVVSYVPVVQVVHELHPEVTAPSELQTFEPESARARVHRSVVCDGARARALLVGAWCRNTVRGRGLLGGSAKAREPRVTHACGAVIFWGAGFTAACAAGLARAVSRCVRGPTIALAATG